jgi:hypothetical protein
MRRNSWRVAKIKKLMTVDDVVDALGGIHGTAEATKRTIQQVCNWKQRNQIPTRLAPVVQHHLREKTERRCKADEALFGFEKVDAA